jgi:hypothetical protein
MSVTFKFFMGFLLLLVFLAFVNAYLFGSVSLNSEGKTDKESVKVTKLANLQNNNGLVVEVFKVAEKDVICVIPIQTTNVVNSRAFKGTSLAPTLSCVKR